MGTTHPVTLSDSVATGDAQAVSERQVLILAPSGNDAQLTSQVLGRSKIEVKICADVIELCRELSNPCGAVLLAEEAINPDSIRPLIRAFAKQPAWSDIPIIIITSSGEADQERLRRLSALGPGSNVILLERPFRPGTLASTVEMALRARQRQYQVRELLQSIRASEARYQHILASISDGFIAIGRDWRITYVNQSYLQLVAPLGITESILGLNFWETVPLPADGESRLRQAMADQQPGSMEIFYAPLQVWLDVRIYPSPETLTIYLRDVTERKRQQDELRAAHAAAEKASRAKDDFLAALSHELRTPLNPVLLLATESAGNPDLAPTLREDFDMIAKNVLLEAHLIDDLLDLTRITRSKLELDRRAVAIHEILQDAITNVRAEVAERDLILEVKFADQNPFVHGDPVRLQQVFWNVLKNAAKFTPRGGRIHVATRVSPSEEKIFVEIADNGTGMGSAEIARIFDAFAQGDHAASGSGHRFGGLGLGLAISRSIVELHAGTIRAESAGMGLGSKFTIELPLIPAPSSIAPLPAAASPAARSRAPIPGLRILLVEDHAPTRGVLVHLLEARNYAVATAASISEGRALGLNGEFDLLITDIGLPDGNGYELMEELGRHRGLRGIALTGYGAEQDVIRAQRAGFVAHLTKPISVRTFDGVLESVMKNVANSRSGNRGNA